MDFNLEKKRVQILLFVVGLIALSIAAEKCRQLVGEERSSQSGKFTFLDCFDMSTGTLACSAKEGVKLYVYNLQSFHVEIARSRALESTLNDAVSQGLHPKDAAKQAAKEGKKAAKVASRQITRITGPIVSSGWDFFEAIYFGGSVTEGFLRGSGTLFGTYAGGFLGEQRLGRLGYLVGSHLGSWIGGRIGLMVYDVVNGVNYLLQFPQTEGGDSYESQEVTEGSESQEVTQGSDSYESQEVFPQTEGSDSYESEELYGSSEL